jgi:DsbC/DsbD-like thiol-disulfide interchange protein
MPRSKNAEPRTTIAAAASRQSARGADGRLGSRALLLAVACLAAAFAPAGLARDVQGQVTGGFQIPGRSDAEVTGESLVATELLPSVGLVEAGTPFDVAIVFRIRRPWHTYWKNPGDSGSAPSIALDLPPGFTAGEIRFPRPLTSTEYGELLIGYEGDVAFFTTITPPATLAAGEPVTIGARLGWMVCTDRCLLGKRDVRIQIPTSGTPTPVSPEVASFAARLPVPAATLGVRAAIAVVGDQTLLVVEGTAADGSIVRFVPDTTPGVRYGEGLPPPATAAEGRFRLAVPLDLRPEDALGAPLRAAGLVSIDPPPAKDAQPAKATTKIVGTGPSTEISVPLPVAGGPSGSPTR